MGFENLSGRTFGQYELREMLGMGGMGAVYRAYHSALDREVAVKVLPRVLAMESGYIERFIREARTAGLLEHPHIVRIYDYGTQGEISYLVMALLRGGSLSQRLSQREDSKRPRASLGEVSLMLNQIGSALDYAHHEGVLHRDIKPANIMFDNQGRAYITDFGIAKLMGATTALTGTGVAMGSPSYMPPEQWAGQDLSAAADQYALGVTIYQTIAGRLPFEADSAAQLMYKHFHEEPTPLNLSRTDIPGSVMLVLNRALAKSPEQRFPNITQFAQSFESAIEGSQGDATNFFLYKVKSEKPLSTSAGTPYAGDPAPVTPGSSRVPVSPTSGGMPPTNTPTSGGYNNPPPNTPTPSGMYASGASPSGAYSAAYATQPPRPWYLSPVALIGGVVTIVAFAIIAVVAILADRPPDNTTESVLQTLTAVSLAQAETAAQQMTLVAQAATETPTEEASVTPEATSTDAAVAETPTDEAAVIATEAVEPSETPEPTDGPTSTPTETATATETPTPTDEPTQTPEPTATNTTEATATFTFTPRPTATQTASATASPEAQAPTAITPGETASGEIGDSAPEIRYEFSGTAGEIYSLTVDTTGGNLDPSVTLYGPDGAIVAANDDISSTDRDAAITAFALPVDGTYTAVVQRFRGARGNSEGTFTFVISPEAAISAEALVYGTPVEGMIDDETPSLEYAVDAKIGMTISAAIYATSGDLDTVLTLYAPDGTVAATNDDYVGTGSNSVIANFSVPADGIYRLVASRFRAATGNSSGTFVLTLTEGEPAQPPDNGEATAIAAGDPVGGTIDAENYQLFYTYDGAVGETITVSLNMTSGDLDPLLRVLNPDGSVLAENDDIVTGNSNSQITATLYQPGIYTIVVTRFRGVNGDTTGDFELVLAQGNVVPPPTDCDEVAIGCTAYISSSILREVAVRTEPRAASTTITNLDAGAQVTIIGGPQLAEAFTWWQVQLMDGNTGWVVARIGFNDVLVTQMP